MTNKFEQFKTWLRKTSGEEFNDTDVDHLMMRDIFYAGWEAAMGES